MACYLQCICLDHENMEKESSHQVVWPHELKIFASTDQVKYGQQFYKTVSCSFPLPHLSKNTVEIIKMIFLPPELEAQTAGKPSLSEIPSCRYLLQSNFNVFSYSFFSASQMCLQNFPLLLPWEQSNLSLHLFFFFGGSACSIFL